MKIQRESQVCRSHLLKMAMLSHRAVDYSVKAYELGDLEFCGLIRSSDQEWRNLQRAIGDRGRALLAAGSSIDAHSLAARCRLRIYSALRVTYTAAAEIAHNSALIADVDPSIRTPEIQQMGRLVNGLVTLYTVALFTNQTQLVKAILRSDQDRHWFDLTLNVVRQSLSMRPSRQARSELAIVRSLGQIAEQAHEAAKAISIWMENMRYLAVPSECAA
ncbi:MAG: hypothetical protein WBQ94_24625 [Terracidiphilus sp.]